MCQTALLGRLDFFFAPLQSFANEPGETNQTDLKEGFCACVGGNAKTQGMVFAYQINGHPKKT